MGVLHITRRYFNDVLKGEGGAELGGGPSCEELEISTPHLLLFIAFFQGRGLNYKLSSSKK